MSGENVARYWVPPVRPRSRRTLVQSLALRLPGLARLYRTALWNVPPRSRLRRELLARLIRDFAEAFNRGDRAAFLAGLDPEIDLNLFGQVGGLGFEDHYHGREGVLRYLDALEDAWESNLLEPQGVIDFGDRYLALHNLRARGRGSGAEVVHAIGLIVTWSGGRTVRVDFYWSQDEALEAVGLRE
jgi:ketosteroid isomerase-like protein